MAQLSKCLPFKHEDLSLIPETMKKNSMVVPKPVTPAPEEQRQKDPWGSLVSLSSHGQARGSVRNLVSKQWWKAIEKEIQS